VNVKFGLMIHIFLTAITLANNVRKSFILVIMRLLMIELRLTPPTENYRLS
jgi:hypothetical protein